MKGLKKNGLMLAGIAATLLASGFVATTSAETKGSAKEVKCSGVNACKGKTSCKSANNACKGQNNCKGTGFVEMSSRSCEQVGGKAE